MKQIAKTGQRRSNWRGYTLDELKYERIATLARIETQEEVISAEYQRMRTGNVFLSQNVFSRVLTMINYTDFMVLGFKLVRSILPLFSKKK